MQHGVIEKGAHSRRAVTQVMLAGSIAVWVAGCSSPKADQGIPVAFQLDTRWPAEGYELVKSRGLDADSSGRIYVAGTVEDPVLVYSPKGRLITSWGQGILAGSHGVRIYHDQVWVTDVDTHQAHLFTLDGKLIKSLGEKGVEGEAPNQFNKPTDFAFSKTGDIYISDGYKNSRVVCYRPDGTVRKIWGKAGTGKSEFNLVHAVAIGPNDRVYVGDRTNGRIQIFDLDGNYITEWNHVGNPYGLYANDNKTIFCCGVDPDSGEFRVLLLDLDGKILTQFGSTGDGPGQFQMAHSLYVDKAGAVYVADGKSNRMQRFLPVY
jgi:peptidylamidoglycolate lyase